MPTLNWLGKDKVVTYDAQVAYHVLNHKYNFGGDTQNKIIHGDNLLALKSLLPLYEGRVKCIYIDPPYNTGNEGWVYNDNVNSPQIQKWLGQVVGREGEDFSRHDKWLCMMYPRLKLLKRLLSDDGAIFISIDDNEVANLKLICNEIFGSQNFINMFIWKKNSSAKTEKTKFAVNTEYVLMYRKSADFIANDAFKPLADSTAAMYNKDDNDGRGKYATVSLQKPASPGPETTYDYVDNNGKIWKCPPKGWRMKYEKIKALENDGRLYFEGKSLRVKDYWNERISTGKRIDTLWNDLPENTVATKELKNIFGIANIFETPKPKKLIERILEIATDKNSIVLDSFAGSGTTAHAVINLNNQDGGNRKFILVEMESYAENITAERVKRVGGNFDFYEVGEEIFIDDELNENLPLEKIREYIWQTETRTPYKKFSTDCEEFLGVHKDAAYYFKFGALDYEFLAKIKTRADAYIIFAETCAIDKEFLYKNKIEFRKIPRDILKN